MSRVRFGSRTAALLMAVVLAMHPVAQAAGMSARSSALARAQLAGTWCGPATQSTGPASSSPAAPAPPERHDSHCDEAPCCLPVAALLPDAGQQLPTRVELRSTIGASCSQCPSLHVQLRLPPAIGPPLH